MAEASPATGTVNTVLGPVPAEELGVVAVHESLLSVYPGAEYGYDVTIDKAAIFDTLKHKLTAFKNAGGGTIVDSTGMFHGRDVYLYESLAKATGVHVIASTGQGPEAMLGGYFLTPQTNPPTPWPAEKFANLFTAEVTEGMVVPRIERRASAGLVTTAGTRAGLTETDESLFRGAARAAASTDTAASFRYGADAAAELEIILSEGLDPSRVLIGGLDRRQAVDAGYPDAVAERGAFVGIDHVGVNDDEELLRDDERVALVLELVAAGHADKIILSSNSTGVAVAHKDNGVAYTAVLEQFIPAATAAGLSDKDARRILVDNPRTLLAGK